MRISVCICAYRRPALLGRLLRALDAQETEGRFTYSIVVADNDAARSSEAVVRDFAASTARAVRYCVEPRQNIALARNKALAAADGDYVAFLDDDECPPPRWLLTMLAACQRYRADGVLGPVRPRFESPPPAWIIDGGFYERPTHPTGCVIDWRKGRTGNLLFRADILAPGSAAFRPQFRVGEDQDFFRRMIAAGRVFVWCQEAGVHEVIPPARWKRTFMVKRALFRGAISPLHPTFGAREVVTSLVAVPAYTALLPVALLLGHGRFMRLVVSLFDHLGRLLALVGIRPFRQAYITE
jgi:succinoglycan biosynthesis protein ExoM